MNKITKVTPSEDELNGKVARVIYCTESDCDSKFKTVQNLRLHVIKHHRNSSITLKSDICNINCYYCPITNCIYNVSSVGSKYFSCMKYLKQHYFKVHAEKKFKCSICLKTFGMVSMLKNHEQICESGLSCAECGWTYSSREALLTHGKRKNHKIDVTNVFSKKEDLDNARQNNNNDFKEPERKKTLFILPKLMDNKLDEAKNSSDSKHVLEKSGVRTSKSTQTVLAKLLKKESYSRVDSNTQTMKLLYSLGTQTVTKSSTWIENDEIDSNLINNSSQTTNNLNNMSYLEDSISCFANQFDSNLCNNQTQTEDKDSIAYDLDQLDSFYNNMHTQTCDDFLSELNLSDIQTQTNWSYNDLLVSTETQTSFSKCLMENSSIQTQTSGSMEFLAGIGQTWKGDKERNPSHCNSIHTQT